MHTFLLAATPSSKSNTIESTATLTTFCTLRPSLAGTYSTALRGKNSELRVPTSLLGHSDEEVKYRPRTRCAPDGNFTLRHVLDETKVWWWRDGLIQHALRKEVGQWVAERASLDVRTAAIHVQTLSLSSCALNKVQTKGLRMRTWSFTAYMYYVNVHAQLIMPSTTHYLISRSRRF